MAQRESNKPTNFEKCYHILEYLKKNTDENHRTTQAQLRKVPELEEYIGDKAAFNDNINAMANAMNFGEYGPKSQEEWQLIFDAFTKEYGDSFYENEDDEEWEQDITEDEVEAEGNKKMGKRPPRRPIKNLYYKHPFSANEVNAIIEGLLFSKTLDTKTANALTRKVEEHLTNKYYAKGAKNICTVYEPSLADKETLRKNLLTLQKAIDNRVQVKFHFCGYDHKKNVTYLRDEKDCINPYYLVANNGKYYLLACRERSAGGGSDNSVKGEHGMSIWRVDMMREIEIPELDEEHGKKGIPALEKDAVANLPVEWDEKFVLSHLNMAYDRPKSITLRVYSPKTETDPKIHKKADYTFLHDSFGDTFQYIGIDKDPDYDIVRVRCSPFAMVNWALQYSNRVEVLEPEDVRKRVVERIAELGKKYGMTESKRSE